MTAILAWFLSSTIFSIIRKFWLPLFAVALLAGTFGIGWREGYSRAHAACREAELKAEVAAKDTAMARLKAALDDANAMADREAADAKAKDSTIAEIQKAEKDAADALDQVKADLNATVDQLNATQADKDRLNNDISNLMAKTDHCVVDGSVIANDKRLQHK